MAKPDALDGRAAAERLLADLIDRGIQVWAAGEELSLRAPKGALDAPLRAALVAQKPILLELLGDRRKHALASFSQERLWFLDQLERRRAVDVAFLAWSLRGRLRNAALTQALRELVRRHETLRTVFTSAEGRAVQVISERSTPAVARIDLRQLPPPIARAEARRLAEREARRPADLQAGPLFRAVLLRLGTEEHLLAVSVHHIVSDGWSMGVLGGELATLYSAFSRGQPSPLAPLPIQYCDFAVAQRHQLDGEALAALLAYWREQLHEPLPEVTVPSDRPRPEAKRYRGAAVELRLREATASAVKALGRREGATLYMTLLAAFLTLLHQLTGEEDLLVGSPIAGRNRRDVEGLIGFFVNTLVLRGDLTDRPTFVELLRRVRETALGAFAHQDLPFERLVEELQPERRPGRHPLIEITFALQNAPESEMRLPDLRLEELEVDFHRASLDLALHLYESRAGLEGTLIYDTDLFDRATGLRLVTRFQRLLEVVTADPGRRVDDLPLLSAGERHQALYEWQAVALAPPVAARCLHELFAEQAAKTPHDPAVVFADEVLTYRELDRRANRLAHRLRAAGVGVETPVGLCLERGPELVVAVWATLKAGAAYVPLAPSLPPERLAFFLDDSRAVAWLTQRRLAPELSGRVGRARRLDLEDLSPLEEAAPSDDLAPPAASDPRQSAYVIYTSGSSGTPKGVVVEHRQVTSYVAAFLERLGLEGGARFCMVQPLAVDSSVSAFYPPLLTGGTLFLLSEIDTTDAQVLARTSTGHAVDVLKIAPTHLAALQESLGDESSELLPRRALVIGGEASRRDWAAALVGRRPGCRVFNHYGPTEATVGTLMSPLGPGLREHPWPYVPIGRPMAHARAHLADPGLRPVPLGAPGEVLLGGSSVTRGYLGRPRRTAESFVPDPYSDVPGERLYRSGDLGRHLADGVVQFLGRRDRQLKIRGLRIEPGEIEAALLRHPEVSEAALVAHRETPAAQIRLVAYFVAASPPGPQAGELRDHLAPSLPGHMVPSAFVELPALPRSAHGKVDQKALDRRAVPATAAAPQELAPEHAAPCTPIEEIVAGIWAELLRVERVGIHDDFFRLGGHSLLAIQVLSRLHRAFGTDISLRTLFERPTVAQLGAEVDTARSQSAPAPGPPRRRGGVVPASFIQGYLWYLERMKADHSTHLITAIWQRSQPLDVSALRRTFQEIVRRHETLRTSFTRSDGELHQVIHSDPELDLPVVDLSGLEGERCRAEGRRVSQAETARPFPAEGAPFFRLVLLRLAEASHVLAMTTHHLVFDGSSWPVFYAEWERHYQAFHRGEASSLPELTLQYGDYASAEHHALDEETWERRRAFWRRQLAVSELFPSTPEVSPGAHHAVSTREISVETSQALEKLSRRQGVTLFTTLLAAWSLGLSRRTGKDELFVAGLHAMRNRLDLERLIGPVYHILALRCDLSGNPSFGELLERLRGVTLDAYRHQETPLEKIIEEVGTLKPPDPHPLFQVLFNFLPLQVSPPSPQGALPAAAPGVDGWEEISPDESAPKAKRLLNIYVTRLGQGIRFYVVGHRRAFTHRQLEDLLDHVEAILAAVAGEADPPIAALRDP